MSAATYLQPTEPVEGVATGTRLTAEQQAVVESNLRLISVVVKPGPNYEDRYQNGVLGLARAAQKFDPAKGFQFSTYAIWWIRAAVQKGGELDNVHGPANARRAAKNGVTLPGLVALDAPLGDESGASFVDLLVADDNPEADALSLARTAELATLLHRVCKDDRDHAVVDALLARSPPSLTEQAHRLGVSSQRVQQLRARLIGRARHPVYRRNKRMTDLPTLEERAHLNGTEAPARDVARPSGFRCDEDGCDREFPSAQGRALHKTRIHGPKKADEGVPSSLRRAPRLDAKSIKADLYDAQDDYDPWALIVGYVAEGEPAAETVILSTEHDADQVSRLLASLGHKAWRFRLADGAHDA